MKRVKKVLEGEDGWDNCESIFVETAGGGKARGGIEKESGGDNAKQANKMFTVKRP